MQASAMDDDKVTHQQNRAPIDIFNVAYQHMTPMVRSAAARNRTRRAEGTREECTGLYEIEEHATRGKTKRMKTIDLMILDMERACSTWNRTAAYKAGQSQSTNCELCGRQEKTRHIWKCKALEQERKEADDEIVALDEEAIPPGGEARHSTSDDM